MPVEQPIRAPGVQRDEASGPAITVVVATRDRPGMLEDTLSAVRSSSRSMDRLVVVDSASRDPAVGAVALSAGAELVRVELPGTCRARNAGWKKADTDLVAFTDDDCLPDPDWLGALATALDESDAGFVTGRVLPDATVAGRGMLTLSVIDSERADLFLAEEDPALMGHGANMAWRREVLEEIGGFDEMLGPGAPLRAAEDHDVFWRALQAGYMGRFEPKAIVRHRQWRSRRAGLRSFYGYGVGSGALSVKRHSLASSAEVADSRTVHARLTRGAIREQIWDHGLVDVYRNIAKGHEMGALAEILKLGGSVRGMLEARRRVLVDGHFMHLTHFTA